MHLVKSGIKSKWTHLTLQASSMIDSSLNLVFNLRVHFTSVIFCIYVSPTRWAIGFHYECWGEVCMFTKYICLLVLVQVHWNVAEASMLCWKVNDKTLSPHQEWSSSKFASCPLQVDQMSLISFKPLQHSAKTIQFVIKAQFNFFYFITGNLDDPVHCYDHFN